MTSVLDKTAQSHGDHQRTRAYRKDFWPGMAGYGLVLGAVLMWGDLDGASQWRIAWALLPVLPMLWVVRAVVRHLRRIDDYQRGLLLQSLGAGFAVAMLTSVTVGFLGVAGLPMRFAGWAIYGAGMLAWLVAAALVHRR